jgi:CheY-like chemotaxis protein
MGSGHHILIIDDSPAILGVLTRLLEGAGYRVAVAANGRAALDYLRQAELPRVILLDLVMPVMDGWQFRHEQQHDPALAGIPVLVLSSESGLPEVAHSLGVAGYFPKPVEFAQLLAAIRVLGGDR